MGKINSNKQHSKTDEIIIVRNATIDDAEKMNSLALEVFKTSDYLIATPEEFSSINLGFRVENLIFSSSPFKLERLYLDTTESVVRKKCQNTN
jgi:hypothetical protein